MLTVVILAKNEELNIVEAIESAKKVSSKVLVIDSGSEDSTVLLAESVGAKVISREWDNNFAAQRNFALEHVDTKWIFYLDADERINDELAKSIKKLVREDKDALYEIERRNSAFGREFKYGVLSSDTVKRLFPTQKAIWQGKVHESVVTDLPTIMIDGYIQHYTYRDFDQYISKMNTYSSIWARDSHKKVSLLKDTIFRPAFAFFKMYILKLGFLEGWLGFILAVNYSVYTLNKYAKLKMK
ncbi:glycosyltransferase family 2 protein [Veillonella criceti]|uniref:SPBc2 prophage-derived glycosyltransferase SunS n=1 Tax=Veillonella criceti TaxID=103891 RepID=A0A380NF23_9FIRM|nr:glycosyltransferase family 2 protein [Veillonella criceti]SUP39459.1 SPBc2 prophage-derived glycosyltransferase SunS [Veillonella criceti]